MKIHNFRYDMEDAMIINKSSFERGFAAGTIYKAVFVDLVEISSGRKNAGRESDSCDLLFARDPNRPELAKFIDIDGPGEILVAHHGLPDLVCTGRYADLVLSANFRAHREDSSVLWFFTACCRGWSTKMGEDQARSCTGARQSSSKSVRKSP